MKKWCYILGIIGFTSLGLGAQSMVQTGDVSVPEPVKSSFAAQFGQHHAAWMKSGMEFEAQFKKNGQPVHAFFSPDGTFAGTESHAEMAELPTNAQTNLTGAFTNGGYTLVATRKRTLPDQTIQWIALLQKSDGGMLKLFYDGSGKLVRRML